MGKANVVAAPPPGVSAPGPDSRAETTRPEKWVDDPTGLRFEHTRSLEGHAKPVSAVRFSPDGTRCASASADKSVRIWNVTDGVCIATLVGHEKGVSDVTWTKCGRYVVSASDDKNIHLWCVDERLRVEMGRWETGHGSPNHLHDSNRVGIQSANLEHMDTPTSTDPKYGQCLRVFTGHTAHVFCVDVAPAGNILASGSCDETVRLWDVAKGTCLNVLPAHSDPVTSVCFSHDGTVVCSGSYDGLVRIWSVATGGCLRTVAVFPTTATDGNDTHTLRKENTIQSGSPPPVARAVFSPNSLFLLIGTLDSTLRLVDLRIKNASPVVKTFVGHVNHAYCVFSGFAEVTRKKINNGKSDEKSDDDGGTSQTYVISGSEDGCVCVWDLQTRRQVTRVTLSSNRMGSQPEEGDEENAGGANAQIENAPDASAGAVVGCDFRNNTLATCGLGEDRSVKIWTVLG